MKKLPLMFCVLSLLFFNSSALAVGLGGFLDYSTGSGEAEWDSDIDEWDIDADTFAGGFVLDTAPTNESYFNYRLNLGIANQTLEDDYGDELDSTGLYVENIFGFAIVQKETFRWWAGPLVRIGFYSGEIDEVDIDVDYFEFGLGGVTGLNFKAGNVILAPSFGFRISGFAGEGESHSYSEDIEGNATTAFVNFAIMF